MIVMHAAGVEVKTDTGQLLSHTESSVLDDGHWLTAESSSSVTITVSRTVFTCGRESRGNCGIPAGMEANVAGFPLLYGFPTEM